MQEVQMIRFGRNRCKYCIYAIIAFVVIISEKCIGQGWSPSEYQQQSVQMSKVDPVYKHSQNMAMLGTITPDSGFVGGFEAFKDSERNYLVIPDFSRFTFWDITNIEYPEKLGSIEFDGQFVARDAEVVQYGDSTRLFLNAIYRRAFRFDGPERTLILDVPFYDNNIKDDIINVKRNYSFSEIIAAGATEWIPDQSITNVEMLYHHDGMLFLATNKPTLIHYDVSS